MFDTTQNKLLLKALIYFSASLVLGLVFTAYFAPETMIALTNQVWAMCGW